MGKSDRKGTLVDNKRSNGDAGPASAVIVPAGADNGAGDLAIILSSLRTMRDGDFSVRLPGYWTGLPGKIADTFNEIVAANQKMARELKRVGQAVGKEGRTSGGTR